MKLRSSITSNSVKLIDLYNKIDSGALEIRPFFQRKLVWKKQHKYAFIETILLNFPFPEIYIASKDVDVETLQAKEVVVDGQQRLSTIVDYIKRQGDFQNQTKVSPFDDLSIEDKKDFLNYSITVKDLKDIGMDKITEVFERINSTDYSLNANERLNARYGEGEFAIFCKLLVENEFNPNEDETEIIISPEIRKKVINFFRDNKVFSENDIKRMFDSQYIMLIAATYLEGTYFGRSKRIDYYLEHNNPEFKNYKDILNLLLNSINIISQLNLSPDSYWFNKANLFTLLVELSHIDSNKINFEYLETCLLDLEKKVDLYFNGDEEDIKNLSADETKYFEVARHSSHEQPAREHRGTVVKSIIQKSMLSVKPIETNIAKNIAFFENSKLPYGRLVITQTGLNKGIMDAVSNVRIFLMEQGVHDYSQQEKGPNHKVKKTGKFVLIDSTIDTEISMYRANGRGDSRIWFSDLNQFAKSNDELLLLNKDGVLSVLNISQYDYTNYSF